MINSNATVKTFSRKNGHIWLLPTNPTFETINGDNFEILGKVTAVMRSVRWFLSPKAVLLSLLDASFRPWHN